MRCTAMEAVHNINQEFNQETVNKTTERPKSGLIVFFFLCFGRGTSIAHRDHGGGLALPESCRGYCRSRYDAEITRNRQ